ncbi:MAG TPA: hypothetical protein PKM01_11790 [Anaerolineaceae bacterium]|nr:hypothetical protein [Anaerolineaceae bacterium]
MKPRTLRNSLFFLLLLACVSCNSIFWKNDPLLIVRDDACEAPCWQGITPGVTTFDEAKILAQNITINISENEVVLPDDVFVVDSSSHPLVVSFDKQSIYVEVEFDDQNIVDRIFFNFDRKHRPGLGEVIQIFGEPESIGLCHQYFEVRRVFVITSYPQIGLFFERRLPIDGDTFRVSYSLRTRVDYLLYRASPEKRSLDFTFPWAQSGILEFSPEERNPASNCYHP